MTEISYDDLFENVRKSWRIVASYQQRIFYLLDEIESGFPELTFRYWEPNHHDRPGRGTSKPTDRWSWDLLPFYSINYWLTPPEKDLKSQLKAGDWFLVFWIEADSSFYFSKATESKSFNGPDPSMMPPTNETDSLLWLYAYRVVGANEDNCTLRDAWGADDTDEITDEWHLIAETNVERFLWREKLSDLFAEEEATQRFILKARTELIKRGTKLEERQS
ncbi:hypothetical protein [uncultured Roseibium sp.]|uniref:hypothetical protein n=1 Tax=uncultured Roseibium sp. TaxID=1936171 RepID=UPI0032165B71